MLFKFVLCCRSNLVLVLSSCLRPLKASPVPHNPKLEDPASLFLANLSFTPVMSYVVPQHTP